MAAAPALAERSALGAIKLEAGQKFFEGRVPPLDGVIGRRAGSVEGYACSEALKAAGIVRTEPAPKAWMEDSQGLIPGTEMRHVGITDSVEQEFILTWLRHGSKGD